MNDRSAELHKSSGSQTPKAIEQRERRALKATLPPSQRDIQRFWFYVDKPDACWPFRLDIDRDGYGNIEWRGKRARAHRVSWELAGRDLPEWPMVLDHICKNRACVNPAHLRVVSQADNTGVFAVRDPVGHSFYRLTAEQAAEIRRRYDAGESPSKLAREFGVSDAHVCGIGKRKVWRTV